MNYTYLDDLGGNLSAKVAQLDLDAQKTFQEMCTCVAQAIAPNVIFDIDENNFPSSVDWYLNQCSIYQFQGQDPTKDNIECYCRMVMKGDSIFIQYWFFYPYNGGLNLEVFSNNNWFNHGFYAHEGDWENICIEVKPLNLNTQTGNFTQMSIPSLRLYRHGFCSVFTNNYFNTTENFYVLEILTNATIHSCMHSHASVVGYGRYDNPEMANNKYLKFLQGIDGSFFVYDYARKGGKEWNTSQNLIYISGNTGQQYNWLDFLGDWGDQHVQYLEIPILGVETSLPIVKGGPSGPKTKDSWNTPDEVSSLGDDLLWTLDPSTLVFPNTPFTSVQASYLPSNGQSFRCSSNFPHWNTDGASYLKFEVIVGTDPTTQDPYPQPQFAIDHDKTGADTRWYSYLEDQEIISVTSGDGSRGSFSLYIGTTKDKYSEGAQYPQDNKITYTVNVFKA